ncbi:MAG: RdgB/HAM1 family non-canonical purine NTP pyrophosphatase [Pseudomonadota bacterium]|nr:RdgB/HAM1 family non-canonical purine NTP pyrophosphatase [Pseudomonadota bacterium]QKK04850.1 MAG: RdgB/HAM1 family non-canonical purine NTP pyrophosphatase [Pseudomonadota bacterium]
MDTIRHGISSEDYRLEDSLVIATHNHGKLREIRDLIGARIPDIQAAGDLGLDDPEETGTTFEENAALKALAAAKATGLPALADDSGLEVQALGGDPGIYSARWAENENGSRDFDYGMRLIWEKLKDEQNHRARFISVLALAFPDGQVFYTEGTVEGEIVWPPRGKNGFGYDPIFQPDGEARTFGEMDADEKHSLSHRAKALREFAARWCHS